MEIEDDIPSLPAETTLEDLAQAGEVLADLASASVSEAKKDSLLADLHTQAELLLCNIKLRVRALDNLPAKQEARRQEQREALAGKLSDLLVLCAAMGYLQGADISGEEEESISIYAEQWDEYIRASPHLTCAVMMESLCSMMLDFVEAQSPDEEDDLRETLESSHVSVIAGCMLLCSQLNLTYDAVLHNAANCSYVGKDDFEALLSSFNKKGL